MKLTFAILRFTALGALFMPVPAVATSWQQVAIPGLPVGSSFGHVWARSRTEAYVWVNQNSNGTSNAQLYRWNGIAWDKVLDVAGDSGQSVYGTGTGEVFAATSINIWRSTDNGQNWA